MAKKLHLSIPEPCHEDWSKMTPTAQGACCQACHKTVVDFTKKSNDEIYRMFEQHEGKICGRFALYQLDSPIIKFEHKGSWFNWKAIAASLAALITAERAAGLMSQNPLAEIEQVSYNDTITIHEQVKKDGVLPKAVYKTVRGRVVDAITSEPIWAVTVYVLGEQRGTVTDVNGNFEIAFYSQASFDTSLIIIKSVGYTDYTTSPQTLTSETTIALLQMSCTIKGEITYTLGLVNKLEVQDDFRYMPDNLLDRYDPKLDIRKKVRNKAKGK